MKKLKAILLLTICIFLITSCGVLENVVGGINSAIGTVASKAVNTYEISSIKKVIMMQ